MVLKHAGDVCAGGLELAGHISQVAQFAIAIDDGYSFVCSQLASSQSWFGGGIRVLTRFRAGEQRSRGDGPRWDIQVSLTQVPCYQGRMFRSVGRLDVHFANRGRALRCATSSRHELLRVLWYTL